MENLKVNGIEFDDYVEEVGYGENQWTQVCDKCLKKYNMKNITDIEIEEIGYGICGVNNCNNEADYYVAFKFDVSNYKGDAIMNNKIRIPEEQIIRFNKMIDNNQHGELLLEIAKYFNLTNYRVMFSAINTIHNTQGHVSNELFNLRRRFDYEMFQELKQIVHEDDFKKLEMV